MSVYSVKILEIIQLFFLHNVIGRTVNSNLIMSDIINQHYKTISSYN